MHQEMHVEIVHEALEEAVLILNLKERFHSSPLAGQR